MSFGLGLLKKDKSDTPSPTQSEAVATPATKGKKRRKPNELLSSVVNESTIASAIDRLRKNQTFALPDGTGWVVLLLSAEAIGGLSQKQQGDEAKGSIIQLISSDQIEIVATAKMLAEEFLAIIPTSETLARMEEYSLLVGAPYHWAVARSADDGAELDLEVIREEATYAEAVSVAAGSRTLSDLFPAEVWSWLSGEDGSESADGWNRADDESLRDDTEAPARRAVEEPAPSEASDADDGAAAPAGVASTETGARAVDESSDRDSEPKDEDSAVGVTRAVNDGDLDLGSEDVVSLNDGDEGNSDENNGDVSGEDEAEFADAGIGSGHDDGSVDDAGDPVDDEIDTANTDTVDSAVAEEDAYRQYVVANESRVITEEEVRATIARRFLTEDLNLEVDLEQFERTFATDAPGVTITLADDPSDWLGSQVIQLTRQANAELEQLHHDNLDELRELYVETMSLHAEEIIREVSTDRAESRYKSLMDGAERDLAALQHDTPAQIAHQTARIAERFEQEADDRAQQAAAHARVQFKNNNKYRVERETAEVGLEIDRRNEEIYAHAKQTILTMRRKDAVTRMDLGATRAMQVLMERQREQRVIATELLQHWNGELTRFIDENRKNDVARADALTEELVRENQVEVNRAEHAARVDELRREQADRVRRLEAEMVAHREEALTELSKQETLSRHNLSLEQERTRSANFLVSTLTDQMAQLKGTLEERYQDRISELESDKRSYATELEWANHVQVRGNRILIILAVLLAVVALAVGIIIGWSWGG